MSIGVLWAACTLSCYAASSLAESKPDVNVQYKLSTGIYSLRDANGPSMMAIDTNLRASSEMGNTWLGFYQTKNKALRQTRIDWDSTYNLASSDYCPPYKVLQVVFWEEAWGLRLGSSISWVLGLAGPIFAIT
jgi:hypothetical protein